jgi:hypothetical protein
VITEIGEEVALEHRWEYIPAKTNNFTSVEMPIGEVEELV